MKHTTGLIVAAVALFTTGVTSVSGQNGPGYPQMVHVQMGPIRQALITPSTLPINPQGGMSSAADQVPLNNATGGANGRILSSVIGSVVGGVAGIGGALVFTALSGAEGWDQLGVFGFGFLVLEPIGVAVGAHLGNGSRGRLGQTILSSYGSLLLGSLAASALASDSGGTGFLVPIIQIGGTVATEHSRANRRIW